MNFFGYPKAPKPKNVQLKFYPPHSEERKSLLSYCKKIRSEGPYEVPIVVNGKRIKTNNVKEFNYPFENKTKAFKVHLATPEILQEAVDKALEAKEKWADLPLDQRCSIFLNFAKLLETKRRDAITAITMMNLGKTMWESEIDVAEMVDFLRFYVHFAMDLYSRQMEEHSPGVWNKFEYRPLEGFIAAVSPFNFISLSLQIAMIPALLGNVVIWKTTTSTALSSYWLYELMEEAGFPKGVVQFVPAGHSEFEENVLKHPMLGGFHFTGSTKTFTHLWQLIGMNLSKYRCFPKLVGETGGKNYHLLHESGDIDNFVSTTVRGAFDYSGQKCSATSRLYVPKSKWDEVIKKLSEMVGKFCKVGPVDEASSYLSSVIDEKSFNNIVGFIERAKKSENAEVVIGGTYSNEKGWFVDPTVILCKDPHYESMEIEIFGPVLSVYVYDDFDEVLKLIDGTSQYALTGSVYAVDRYAITKAMKVLRYACGNFYINDKCTGAMAGQQFFGGSRKSGTNDKTGSFLNLTRWVSPRTIKEQFVNTKSPQYKSTIPD